MLTIIRFIKNNQLTKHMELTELFTVAGKLFRVDSEEEVSPLASYGPCVTVWDENKPDSKKRAIAEQIVIRKEIEGELDINAYLIPPYSRAFTEPLIIWINEERGDEKKKLKYVPPESSPIDDICAGAIMFYKI